LLKSTQSPKDIEIKPIGVTDTTSPEDSKNKSIEIAEDNNENGNNKSAEKQIGIKTVLKQMNVIYKFVSY
jgi:hypothetical protein